MATSPTITSGLGGAKIYSNPETERILKGGRGVGYDSPDLRQTLDKNNKALINTIRNKRETHINFEKREISDRKGNYWKKYKNVKFNL